MEFYAAFPIYMWALPGKTRRYRASVFRLGRFVCYVILGQHRTIRLRQPTNLFHRLCSSKSGEYTKDSATFSVFLRQKNLSLTTLAELCGAAHRLILCMVYMKMFVELLWHRIVKKARLSAETEKEEGACLPLVFRFCLTQPQQPEPDGHCRCRKPCKLCGALRAHRTWGKPQHWERTASS